MSWNRMHGAGYATPRPCRLCGQMRTREYFEQREKNRLKLIASSLQLAKKEGRRVGRPRIHDYAEIMRVRIEGQLSITETAIKMNIGRSAVINAVVDYKKRNKLNAIGGENDNKENEKSSGQQDRGEGFESQKID